MDDKKLMQRALQLLTLAIDYVEKEYASDDDLYEMLVQAEANFQLVSTNMERNARR
jgi:hypothetical protein